MKRFSPPTFEALVKLFRVGQQLSKKDDEDPDAGLTQIDYEEQTAGYQAAYSRLAAAETAPVDPVAHVRDLPAFVGQEFAGLSGRFPDVAGWVVQTDANLTGTFLQGLASAGYKI